LRGQRSVMSVSPTAMVAGVCSCTAVYRFCVFFLNATPPTAIYPLSLHDALPISSQPPGPAPSPRTPCGAGFMPADGVSAVAAVQPAFAGRDKPGPTDSSQPV